MFKMRIRYLICIAFYLFSFNLSSQIKLNKGNVAGRGNTSGKDSSVISRATGFKKLASIDMYLQYNSEIDTVRVDTTLSIKKDYKFNYLQRDNFGLMPFANIGQSYNTLSFDAFSNSTKPLFGARARHFNYFENKDIRYHEVPTPWTRLTYKTAFEQGQMLDAAFAINLSKQFNFSLAYKGLRSLGNYQNTLTSSGNFRFTSTYKTKNERYKAKAHIAIQDLLNQENGGLDENGIENFVAGEEEFIDRSVFDPNFENAENILRGKRFYLDQSFDILKKKDSLSNNTLAIINSISFEDKYYQFDQTTPDTAFFGNAFTNTIKDKVTLENLNASIGLNYSNNLLGEMMFAVNYSDINYGYDAVVIFPNETLPNRIKTNFVGIEASYAKTYKGFKIGGQGGLNLSDQFVGSFLNGSIEMKLFDDFILKGNININTRRPDYNHLLYQSDYINYNWSNINRYNNVNTQQLRFSIISKKIFNAEVDITNIDNYTYFDLGKTDANLKVVSSKQFNKPLQYMRLKVQKEIKLGRFSLDNTLMYQNVVSDDNVLNVPTFITRNTLYYSNQLFKKAMTLQTGVTFNYFTKYYMNGYDSLLAEFYTQNDTELGGFPRLDFFINVKVRQTRIFLKAEHFNSSFTGYDYFSAPNYPYRDFTIRFGLVWDFFL